MVDPKSQFGEAGPAVRLSSLSEAQLTELYQNLQNELENLSNILATFRSAKERYEEAAEATLALNDDVLGREVLIPLTGCVYVPGHISDVNNVLVSVGTGYHVEKSVPSAAKYCEKKRDMVGSKIQELTKVMSERRKVLHSVQSLLQERVATRERNALAAAAATS